MKNIASEILKSNLETSQKLYDLLTGLAIAFNGASEDEKEKINEIAKKYENPREIAILPPIKTS